MRALAGKIQTNRIACLFIAVTFLLSTVAPNLLWPARAEAAIGFRASTAVGSTASVNALSLTLPAGTLEGDVLIATVVISNGNTITAPNGWTRISPVNGTPLICANGTTTTVQTWYKEAGATEAGPYSFSWVNPASYASGGITAYTGVNGSSPIDTSTNGTCTTGTGTALTASGTSVSTASANAYVIGVWGQMNNTGNTANTITSTGMTNRVQVQSTPLQVSCGFLCTANTNAATVNQSDVLQAAAGAVATKSATSNISGAWAGYVYALKPALYNFSQSAYRWFGNKDTLDGLAATSNATSGDDKSSSIALDAANGVIYTAGYEGVSSDNRWRIEKRLVSDGSLVSAFGGSGCTTNRGGAVCSDPTTGDDQILDIAIDTTGGFLYAAGYDSTGSNRWRVEKRSLGDGSLATGTTSGGFVAGILVLDPNPSLNDQIYAVSLDISGGAMFLGGRDGGGNSQWRLEKRTMSTGVYVSAFGTGGVTTNDISSGGSKDEFIYDLALDPGSGVMYVAGFDGQPSGANAFKWRVEKYSMTTGALGTNFGGSAPCTTDGIYCLDTNTSGGASDDRATTLALDSSYLFIAGIDSSNGGQWRVARITLSSNTISSSLVAQNVAGSSEESIKGILSDGSNIYLAGYDNAGSDGAGGSSYRWRIEKRTVAGALVSAFGTAGVVTSDPTVASDQSTGAAIDTANGFIYANGFDANGSNRWRVERRSTTDGGSGWALQTLAAQDTLASPDDLAIVRLRLLMHNNTATLWGTDPAQSFKIRYAQKSGTCDTAYIGEVFNDLTSSGTDLRFYDNSSGDTGDNTAVIPGDPAHGSDVSKLQAYVESNNFNNNGTIKVTEDGLWDFAIQQLTAYGGYCFKVVKSDGSDISVPTQVPEIEYCAKPRETDVLRGGGYFCNGSERRFFWSL